MIIHVPYGRQEITDDDINAVINALKSDFITQGPLVPKFETAVASLVGSRFAVATNSATTALHIACRSLGLGQGDWLWTSPITFVASANCALYCGAGVDFVDIDPKTYNISVLALEDKLKKAELQGRLPKIVMPVHLCGQVCEMEEIKKLSDKYGFKIIEDASHAIGATYQNEYVGNNKYSDITVFSFHPVKIITTAEGGMAMTNSLELSERMKLLRSHGITRDSNQMTCISEGPWYYQQIDLGYNYRMTEIQAALGLSQLARLNEYVKLRRKIAKRYDKSLNKERIVIPWQHTRGSSAWHLYVVRLKLKKLKKTHREIFESLAQQGIGVNVHYIPVHLQPYYQGFGFKRGDFLCAEEYYSEAISLPIFPTLSESDQKFIISKINEISE